MTACSSLNVLNPVVITMYCTWSSGGALSTVDMVVQRRDGPRRLRHSDDDDAVFYVLEAE